MNDVHEGGCLCTAIRYRFSGTALATSMCHCRSCRRATGATRVAWLVARSVDFEFTAALPQTFRSSPEVTRSFCARCGTSLTYRHDESPHTVDIAIATLDEPERFAPMREVWLDDKISWEIDNPRLRQYAGSSAGPSKHDR